MDALVRSRNRSHRGSVDRFLDESERKLVEQPEPSRALLSGAEH